MLPGKLNLPPSLRSLIYSDTCNSVCPSLHLLHITAYGYLGPNHPHPLFGSFLPILNTISSNSCSRKLSYSHISSPRMLLPFTFALCPENPHLFASSASKPHSLYIGAIKVTQEEKYRNRFFVAEVYKHNCFLYIDFISNHFPKLFHSSNSA